MSQRQRQRGEPSILDRVRSRQREWTRQGHAWLRARPRLKRWLDASGCLTGGPEGMARGVGVGLFVGLTPTVGFQTLFMVAGCVVVRGNFPMAFAVSFVSNPLTMGPLYWGFHSVGRLVDALSPMDVSNSAAWYLQGVGDDVVLAGLGSLVVAIPVAVAGYFVSHRISVALQARRRQRGQRPVRPGNA